MRSCGRCATRATCRSAERGAEPGEMLSRTVRLALLALLCGGCGALVPAAAVQARVALIATGTNDAALLDVATGKVSRKVALPGPTTAVAVTRDGKVGFAAGGG